MTVYEGMAAVIKAVEHIAKQRSGGVKYEFRGIDQVMNHLHGPLATNGLFLSPRVLDDWQLNMIPGTENRMQSQALFRVCVDVYSEDGSMVTLGPGLAQSHDYGDKAVYQAQQNAIKYLLLEAFCIPTTDDMDGRDSGPVPSRNGTSSSQGVDRLLITRVEEGDGFLKLCPSCSDPLDDRRATFVPGGKDPAWKCPNRDCVGGSPKKNGNGHWSWASWNPHEFDDSPQTRWAKNTLWGLVIQDRQKALEAAAVGPDIDDNSLGRAFYLECLNVSGQVEPLTEDAAKAVVEAAEQIIPPKVPDSERPF